MAVKTARISVDLYSVGFESTQWVGHANTGTGVQSEEILANACFGGSNPDDDVCGACSDRCENSRNVGGKMLVVSQSPLEFSSN